MYIHENLLYVQYKLQGGIPCCRKYYSKQNTSQLQVVLLTHWHMELNYQGPILLKADQIC